MSPVAGVPLLDGVTVLDLTTFLSGPFGTQLLADLGARVVKLETLAGDSSRAIPPHFVGDDSAYYLGNNRSKESIAVDLKTPDGLAIAKRLIASADVVVENYRPGVSARLGLDPERLRAERPELIWASISGFGQTGLLKDLPAYDMIVQALAGVMSLTGERGRPAMRLGIPAGDLVGGMFASVGVLAALVRRARTGEGATIDVSMFDGQISMLSYQAVYAMITGTAPQPQGARHDSIPTYRSFVCGDGRELVVTANTERMWASLCETVGHPELVDDVRFSGGRERLRHRDALWEILEPAFLAATVPEWVDRLRAAGVPVAPINSVTEALDLARSLGRDMVVELEDTAGHKVSVIGNPVKVEGLTTGEAARFRYPPTTGADTVALLGEIGFAAAEIEDLLDRGVVRAPIGTLT